MWQSPMALFHLPASSVFRVKDKFAMQGLKETHDIIRIDGCTKIMWVVRHTRAGGCPDV